MLKTSSLSYTYPGGEALRFPAMECQAGEHWLILGSSGSGKTTLLQLLAGLRKPAEGEVRIGTTAINTLAPAALDRFRGQNIGIVFQQSHFIRALNVEENLIISQQLAGKPVDRTRIRKLVEHLGLGRKLKSPTHRLSQGEQQRVAIARALVNNPTVILADEPTSALDDQNTSEVVTLLEEEASIVNATLIVVTHDGRLKSKFPKQVAL